MRRDETGELHAHYELGAERGRLDRALGALEFERTKELIDRVLPSPPGIVADVGGGPGRYAFWLAERGFHVQLRDIIPLHIEQLETDRGDLPIEAAVGDARDLDLADRCVDAVLLLGPLYHLATRADRLRALSEARRIVRPGGFVFAAAISRWATRLDGILNKRIYVAAPETLSLVADVERSGRIPALGPGGFVGYAHRPSQLRSEVRAASLELISLVSIEGAAALLGDLEARVESPDDWRVILESARATEAVPELLGVGPHLLATCRRSDPQDSGC